MYWVIDTNDDSVSWSAKAEAAEHFDTRVKATKRAKELAEMNPGVIFAVVHAVAEVVAPVSRPEVRDLSRS